MTQSLSVMESGSGEKREGGLFQCAQRSQCSQALTLFCIKSWSQEQGRAQMGGRLQVTPQPLAQPSLAGCLCSPVTPCLCLPLSIPLSPSRLSCACLPLCRLGLCG